MSALQITYPTGRTARVEIAKPSWSQCECIDFTDEAGNDWEVYFRVSHGVDVTVMGYKLGRAWVDTTDTGDGFNESATQAVEDFLEESRMEPDYE